MEKLTRPLYVVRSSDKDSRDESILLPEQTTSRGPFPLATIYHNGILIYEVRNCLQSDRHLFSFSFTWHKTCDIIYFNGKEILVRADERIMLMQLDGKVTARVLVKLSLDHETYDSANQNTSIFPECIIFRRQGLGTLFELQIIDDKIQLVIRDNYVGHSHNTMVTIDHCGVMCDARGYAEYGQHVYDADGSIVIDSPIGGVRMSKILNVPRSAPMFIEFQNSVFAFLREYFPKTLSDVVADYV